MASEAVAGAQLRVAIAAVECEIVVKEAEIAELRANLSQVDSNDATAVAELVEKIRAEEDVLKAARLKLEGLSPPKLHKAPLSGFGTHNTATFQLGQQPQFFQNAQASQHNLQQFNQGGALGMQGLSLDTPRPGANRERNMPYMKSNLSPIRSRSGERTFNRTFNNERDSSEEGTRSSSRSSRSRISKPRRYKKSDDICLFLDRFLDYTENSKLKDDRMDLQLVELIDDERMYRKIRKISDKLTREESRRPELLVRAIKRLLYKEEGDLANTADLRNLVQGPKEQVEDFSFRITDAVTKIGVDDREGAMLQATTFIQGLRSEIRDRMGSKAKSMKFDFNGLVDLAEKYEMQMTRPRREEPVAEQMTFGEVYAMQSTQAAVQPAQSVSTCKKCGKAGHEEQTCWAATECQLCGKRGHLASRCSQLQTYATSAANLQQPAGSRDWETRGTPQAQPSRFGSAGENRSCYNCGVVGHLSRACRAPRPDRGQQEAAGRGSYNQSWRNRELPLNWKGAGGHSIPPAQPGGRRQF